jgi:hypothetical protein
MRTIVLTKHLLFFVSIIIITFLLQITYCVNSNVNNQTTNYASNKHECKLFSYDFLSEQQ